MHLQGMDQNNFLDAIDHEAIKVKTMPTIKTAFLKIALRQKLHRHFLKDVNNISHCQACFLTLKFPWLKIFKFFVCSIIKMVVLTLLSNYQMTCGTLIKKQHVSTQTVQVQ